MALQWGVNITASDMRKLLEQNHKQQSGVRTWRQLFGNAGLGYNSQTAALTSDYSDAIAQAYKSNLAQRNAILGAGLNTGATNDLLAQNRSDLRAAYQTYIQNYQKGLNTVTEDYLTERNAIDTALTARASNFANLYNSAYDYLVDELAGSTFTEAGNAGNGATPIYEGKRKNAKLVGYEDVTHDYLKEHGLGWVVDENGNLLSKNQIFERLLNADGSLNEEGTRFFDAIFNSAPEKYMNDGERLRGFDEWLSGQEKTFADYDDKSGMAKNGRELRDWWVSQDVFNYTLAGTNKGTAQTLVGLESTDSLYGNYEYATNANNITTIMKENFATYNKGINDAIGTFESKLDKINSDARTRLNNTYANTPPEYAPGGANSKKTYEEALKTEMSNYNSSDFKEIETAYHTYYQDLAKSVNDLQVSLKEQYGTAAYNEFMKKYEKDFEAWNKYVKSQEIFDVYDALLNSITEENNYTLSVDQLKRETERAQSFLQRLYREIEAYFKDYKYRDKLSGF